MEYSAAKHIHCHFIEFDYLPPHSPMSVCLFVGWLVGWFVSRVTQLQLQERFLWNLDWEWIQVQNRPHSILAQVWIQELFSYFLYHFFFFLHFSTFLYVSFRILLKHFSCIQVAGIYGWEQLDADKGNCWALMEVCALHLSYILCLWLPRCGQKINQCSFNWLFPVPSLLEQQFSSFPREPMGRSCIPNVHLFK